ncbi:hypothetical protein [Roseibium aggregatum]|uniref:SAM dependent carboxyl methyltransferase n=1 Tax=Roseibium aggregatum TaxID=187304 RepID=A0A939EFV9_9HYPH|nr:hypothetical protein [Roseibium aggregatum]MBN9671423.1 hypothetical protein [Roseibium aggregatum]
MSTSGDNTGFSAHSTTSGMVGGGFYNANSSPQWKAIEAVLPFLDQAAQGLPVTGSGPVCLADFGCSEGRNSIEVMQRVLASLLPRTDRPVQTIHSDLPTNDFSKLFLNLRPEGRPVFDCNRVFSAAVGGSMYDQLLPDRSLHLATTFNAIGFLSRRPVEALPGYIIPNGPSKERGNGFVADDDRSAFAEQAKQDVGVFLQRRARELVPGGKLLVQVFGANEAASTCDGLYDLLNDAVLVHVDQGEISRETYERYYQPVYMRTLDELIAPVTEDSHGAGGLFEIEETKSYEIAVPFNERFRSDGDLDRYATDYVNFFRAFTQTVLTNALPETPDRDTLVNRVYEKAVDLLKANPERYPFRYIAIAMLLTRRG